MKARLLFVSCILLVSLSLVLTVSTVRSDQIEGAQYFQRGPEFQTPPLGPLSGGQDIQKVELQSSMRTWPPIGMSLKPWEVAGQDAEGDVGQTTLAPDEFERVELYTQAGGLTHFWGAAAPGDEVTITTPDYSTTVVADAVSGEWSTEPIMLHPGDAITAQASMGALVSFSLPDPYFAEVDTDLDRVSGQVGGSNNEEWEIHGEWFEGEEIVLTDATGSFSHDFSDIPAGSRGYIRKEFNYGPVQVILHRAFLPNLPVINVNYAHDWVEGEYEPGHAISVRVEDALGALKATAEFVSGNLPEWGGRSGFGTWKEQWTPRQLDLVPGDLVEVTVDDAYSSSVRIGTITGSLNIAADNVTGTITAEGFTNPLNANCSVWIENGVGMDFTVAPNGGAYSCDLSSLMWDLLPGHDVAVAYQEPDGHWIINVFREPAPVLGVWTWGEGEPTTGGNYIFNVHYNNWGDATAEDVTLISEFSTGVVYLGDTLGITPTGSGAPGNPLVWELGDLPAENKDHWFQIFIQVNTPVGDTISHAIEIGTSTVYAQSNLGDLQSYWETLVVENDTHLNIGKGAWTWNPAPGYDFVYWVDVCNNGSTSSSEVTLTDGLPPETSLVSWWAREYGWEEVSVTGNQIVLSIPTIPGYGNCRQVYYRVALKSDAWPNVQLYNRAEIAADNDLEADDNVAEIWHDTADPRYLSRDLGIWKDWNYGETVPGGYLQYEIGYRNHGQVPIEDVTITETLPANTTFVAARYWDKDGEHLLVPSQVTEDMVIWELGTLDNGYEGRFVVELEISESAVPGDLLENRFEITRPLGDERWDNNQIVWIDQVNEPGPNLHLYKNYWWDGPTTGMESLSYEIRVHNFGTEFLEDLCVVDTLPASTHFEDEIWFGHGPWDGWTYNAGTHQLEVCTSGMQPGETASASFRVQLDEDVVGERGLSFTNLVSGEVDGDVNLEDNSDEVTVYTAADIYVQAELVEGEIRPGETFTLAIQFGNLTRWPWNSDESTGSSITLKLPPGLEYVTASHVYNVEKAWYPFYISKGIFRWGWGTIWGDSQWVYFLTLRVDKDVELGQAVPVTLEAFSDNPDEVELVWDNNTFIVDLNVIGEFIYLPVMSK